MAHRRLASAKLTAAILALAASPAAAQKVTAIPRDALTTTATRTPDEAGGIDRQAIETRHARGVADLNRGAPHTRF